MHRLERPKFLKVSAWTAGIRCIHPEQALAGRSRRIAFLSLPDRLHSKSADSRSVTMGSGSVVEYIPVDTIPQTS